MTILFRLSIVESSVQTYLKVMNSLRIQLRVCVLGFPHCCSCCPALFEAILAIGNEEVISFWIISLPSKFYGLNI